jgi:hypothetical protein
VYDPDAVQKAEVELEIYNGGSVWRTSNFVVYFDSNVAAFDVRDRARGALLSGLPLGQWTTAPFSILNLTATEVIDGIEGGTRHHDGVRLIAGGGADNGYLLDPGKRWIQPEGHMLLHVQNMTDTAQDVRWELTAISATGSVNAMTGHTLPANSLGSVMLKKTDFSGHETAYKLRVRVLVNWVAGATVEFHIATKAKFFKEFWFMNPNNVWESFHCWGAEERQKGRHVAPYEYERSFGQEVQRTWWVYDLTTQALPRAEAERLAVLLDARKVVEKTAAGLLRDVFILNTSAAVSNTDDETMQLKIQYRYAEIQS